MKFSLSWLKVFLDTNATIIEISNALNSLGLEVEEVIDRSKDYNDFIVAHVEDVKKHPNADKLNWCKVNNGSEVIDIVTGATNVRKGLKVVLAPVGSVIPTSKLKMEKRSLRGIESYGMLCSSTELGLGSDSDGIMELSDNYKEGTKLIEVFPELSDVLFEISITPNRPDCLGVYGIARELESYGLGKLKTPNIASVTIDIEKILKVDVENSEDCTLYIGRYFQNISNKESPSWLQALLKSVGKTPISALVDITNYISHSFARPLHVYDADSIKGDVTVRRAKDDEQFIDLDKKEYKLSLQDIVIADNEKVIGLAGIMGGDASKCELKSTSIYLEAGVFDSRLIAKSSKRLKITSDAKHIFERGVDHNFTMLGALIASQLIHEICGGEAGAFSVNGAVDVPLKNIDFDVKKIQRIGGIEVEKEKMTSILNSLGFKISDSHDRDFIKLQVPSWRHDIQIDEDIVEEVMRLNGYDNIPYKLISSVNKTENAISSKEVLAKQARRVLSANGYNEMVTYSFISSDDAKKFNIFNEDLLIENPISVDLNIMRQSILPNLVNIAQKNYARLIKDLSIFEIGPIFNSSKVGDQIKVISGIRVGENSRINIYKDNRNFDFFDVKADLCDVLDVWNIKDIEFLKTGAPSWYHPGKACALKFKNKVIGYLGELHPSLLEHKQPIIGFELFLDSFDYQEKVSDEPISDYQPLSRDFAFIISKTTAASDLVCNIMDTDKSLITDAHIFDIYEDDSIGADKKSIAIRVTIHPQDKTLNNDEIELICSKIIKSVEKKSNASLRLG